MSRPGRLDALHAHGADLELGHAGHRVERGVSQLQLPSWKCSGIHVSPGEVLPDTRARVCTEPRRELTRTTSPSATPSRSASEVLISMNEPLAMRLSPSVRPVMAQALYW